MPKSTLFESESFPDDTIWSGEYNGVIIEIFERDETDAEEVYALVNGDDILGAAIALASFLEDSPIDGVPFGAYIDPEDPTTVVITVQDQEYTTYSVENEESTGTLYIATDLQLEDDEIEYLQQNGKLPGYSDEDLDTALADVGDDDDFW
ncbi:hypothetical protein RCIP0012_00185 [Klebsiella phage RCIP0012]